MTRLYLRTSFFNFIREKTTMLMVFDKTASIDAVVFKVNSNTGSLGASVQLELSVKLLVFSIEAY